MLSSVSKVLSPKTRSNPDLNLVDNDGQLSSWFYCFFIELQLTKTLILNHLLALQKYDL